jgi:Histidine-specific methyltransferase, SAM-dependent
MKEELENTIDLEPYLRRGMVPTKFGYLASGASNHMAYSASTQYSKNMHQIEFDLQAISQFRRRFDKHQIQIVDLGAGDGDYTVSLFTDSDMPKSSRYLAVDISLSLATYAAHRLRAAGISDTRSLIWDFEETDTNSIEEWRHNQRPLLCLLLGNTLSNLEDPVWALRKVVASIKEGDCISISVRLWNTEATAHELLNPYDSDELRAAILSSFASGGIEGDFLLTFDLEEREVIGKASLAELRKCPSNLTPHLTIGKQYLCFRSRRWLLKEFYDCMAQAGLSLLWSARNSDFATALAEKL